MFIHRKYSHILQSNIARNIGHQIANNSNIDNIKNALTAFACYGFVWFAY